jgi:cell division protein FtsQ
MWVAIGAGMLSLLIAAMGKQKKDTCKDYSITVKATKNEDLFLDEAGVLKLLKAATKGNVKGQPKAAFNLQQMEQLLEENVWVKDAQLYFDNKDVLHVSVTEREPVARIFTAGGRSFYIDESAQIMQLSDKVSVQLPVFTGFPDKKKLTTKDSVLLKQVNATATYISAQPFWAAQVAQIDIASCGPDCWEFDMVPVIGNHTVKLGNGENIEQKFNRLFIFYKQVLSKTGFDLYKTVDVRFAGQVVGAKSENPKVDQAQLKKNVDALLRQIKEAEQKADSEARTVNTATDTKPVNVMQAADAERMADRSSADTEEKPAASNPTSSERKPTQPKPAVNPKPAEPKPSVNRTPRAVMPKRTTTNR